MTRIVHLILGLVVATSLCAGQDRDSVGVVRVTVLDGRDLPVQGAKATASPVLPRGCVLGYALPDCLSDRAGRCMLRLSYGGKCLGRYIIWASKEEDDYPPLFLSFYSAADPASKQTEVTLLGKQPSEAVIVHLGKRAGVLVGTVADAVTGKPLNANVAFRWVSDPTISLSGSGLANAHFRILVPSDTPVTMVVSLKGYEDWTYSMGRGALWNAILLRPGEGLTLDIRLRPKESN
jgi:hypothetical protein